MNTTAFVALLATLAASAAGAHEFSGGDLTIDHPYTHPTPGVALTAITYLTISNAGSISDRLLAVDAPDFEDASLHRTEIVDGVARMRSQADGVVVEPGQTVLFEPGGYHIMLEGLGGDPIEPDETFEATLIFERAGRVDIVIAVEPRNTRSMETDHGNHSTD